MIFVLFFASVIRSSMHRKGSFNGGRNVRPCILMMATSLPLTLIYTIPFPGVPSGKFAGRIMYSDSSINSKTSFLSHAWLPNVTTWAPHSRNCLYIISVIPFLMLLVPVWHFCDSHSLFSVCIFTLILAHLVLPYLYRLILQHHR